jgi:hypothetical protein
VTLAFAARAAPDVTDGRLTIAVLGSLSVALGLAVLRLQRA